MNILSKLASLVPALEKELAQAVSLSSVETLRVQFLGRKGQLAQIMSRLPELAAEDRPAAGKTANSVKESMLSLLTDHEHRLEQEQEVQMLERFDPTLPSRTPALGTLHPVFLVMDAICTVFERLGYDILSGPEVETDFHNFEALNFPLDHPARDMQDTLYIRDGIVLRTHTSPMQVRSMLEKKQPPLAVMAPGKVYRRDSDMTHSPMFHQCEGLLVDKNITFTDLRGTLQNFIWELFGRDVGMRFRPSFFPFTEPSVEVDISCIICKGTGSCKNEPCRVCKSTGWVEILGGGMIDPAVFSAVGFDPEQCTGFAFGLGVERVAMLKYGIGDLRLFFENDIRFLKQFGA